MARQRQPSPTMTGDDDLQKSSIDNACRNLNRPLAATYVDRRPDPCGAPSKLPTASIHDGMVYTTNAGETDGNVRRVDLIQRAARGRRNQAYKMARVHEQMETIPTKQDSRERESQGHSAIGSGRKVVARRAQTGPSGPTGPMGQGGSNRSAGHGGSSSLVGPGGPIIKV
ncbi:hypothetical protein ACLOJK_019808 [Asimina triloba]